MQSIFCLCDHGASAAGVHVPHAVIHKPEHKTVPMRHVGFGLRTGASTTADAMFGAGRRRLHGQRFAAR